MVLKLTFCITGYRKGRFYKYYSTDNECQNGKCLPNGGIMYLDCEDRNLEGIRLGYGLFGRQSFFKVKKETNNFECEQAKNIAD